MIYESAAITDYRQESSGVEGFGESLPANHPAVVAAIWPNEKSIQQQQEIRTGADRSAVSGG